MSYVAASKVLSQRELCQIEVEGNELVCSHDREPDGAGEEPPSSYKTAPCLPKNVKPLC